MASVAMTPVICPRCRRPFSAQIQQIYDVGQDPSAKSRFLRWQPAAARCPHCGYNGALATPLLYHDPDKELLLIYVPIELALRQNEQERLVGDLTNRVINALPPEKRKGYLLQPKMALSQQGMLDTILAADGITPEIVNEQKERIGLIDSLLRTPEEQLPTLAAELDSKLDMTFFQLLNASIEAAAQEGQTNVSQQLAALREHLLPLTSLGRRAQRQAAAMAELEQAASQGSLTPELLLERLAAADEDVLEALLTAARPLVDYNFFMLLAERIGQAEGRGDKEETERLKALRERILALTAEIDRRNRAVLDRAAQTLRAIMQAPDLQQALEEHAPEIDDAFMAVLQANIEAAQQAGQRQALQRLQQISDAIMELMQASAPAEIQLINQLLSLPSPEGLDGFLQEHRAELTPELTSLMSDIADNMRDNNRPEIAERLDQLRGKIGNLMASE